VQNREFKKTGACCLETTASGYPPALAHAGIRGGLLRQRRHFRTPVCGYLSGVSAGMPIFSGIPERYPQNGSPSKCQSAAMGLFAFILIFSYNKHKKRKDGKQVCRLTQKK
jgi:hypothetical protein